jgi:adenylate cyclase class IV
MSRHLELTARLYDVSIARETAQRLSMQFRGVREHHETYFHFSHDLIKLREAEGRPAELIWYTSTPYASATINDYAIVEIPRRSRIEALKRQMSVTAVVARRRESFSHHGVQIHLDEVAGAGPFLHLEIVLDDRCDERAACVQLAQLQVEFNIAAAVVLPSPA